MPRGEYHDAQIKIWLLLIAVAYVAGHFVPEWWYPDWWSVELSSVAGLAILGALFWLSGVLDRWLKK